MKRACSFLGVLVVLGASMLAGRVAAQGVTSAAVEGRLTSETGEAVDNGTVTLVNASTGQRYGVRSSADGRYFFENVAVGGPYTLEVRALGFEPRSASGLQLVLGQRFVQDFAMRRAAIEVAGLTVTAEADPLINPSRTGAQTFVSDTAIARLPTLNRNFTDFIQTVPQVVGTSVAGQNNRFNNIQIDGGVNNDLFGLSPSGTPGGSANARPISIEAVKEYQVLIAPFDIRQGNFTGGLINAVTKSGTNRFHGSVFGYLQNQSLVGKDSLDNRIAEFDQTQYGFSASGPIVPDRVHFLVAVDLKSRDAPFGGLTIGDDTTGGADSVGIGIRRATAERVTQIVTSQYGFDPGTYTAPVLANPDKNIFAKLSGQLGTNSHVELSYNFVDAGDDNLIRAPSATGFRDGYQLSNSGYEFQTKTNTARAKWNAVLASRFSNELILGYSRVRDFRTLPNRAPLVLVGGDRAGTNIAVGGDRFSHANTLDQDIFEVTDNVTFARGTHLVTVGTHNEFFGFRNVFFEASLGVWSFLNADSLAAARPFRFERFVAGTLRPEGPISDFDVQQYGFYIQDRWAVTPKLTLTGGLRVDIPTMGSPPTNPVLDTATGLQINTGDFPSGNPLWSPRLGFSYDVAGDASTFVRGGIGVFSGRPPYVWVSNAFGNTGLEQATLICTGVNVPAFTVNPDSQPTTCGAGAVAPIPTINYFDPDFKFPQNLKVALGVDHRLPSGLVATVDFLYTKWVNQFYFTDANLRGIVGASAGEFGRPLYGTISPTTGSATPSRFSGSFRDVIGHRNESSDRSFSLTAQLQKRFSDGVEFDAAYTYSRTEDLFSLTSSRAQSNFRNTPLDGTLDDRRLRTSGFDIPHKLVLSGTVSLPYKVLFSLIYIRQSGSPYTYVVSGDANADGVSNNDMIYVPRNAGDIRLANPADTTALFNYINGEACLRAHRGAILTRNTCRNPSRAAVNARLVKVVPTVSGQSLELTMDLFNVPQFLNSDWGLVRETASFQDQSMLRLTGYDTATQRGIYALALPVRERVLVDASRWRLQFGVRYVF
ncbi:MAG: TonB-dependent receptor [Gemmatimonadales bacterium]